MDMTSRERVAKTLMFETPDRVGIHDTFLTSTIDAWTRQGLPKDTAPEEYFDIDFDFIKLDDALSGKGGAGMPGRFRCLTFSEPFQQLCGKMGIESALRALAASPHSFRDGLKREAATLMDGLSALAGESIVFDGAWVWGDIAYKGGAYISPSSYRRLLYPIHKRVFSLLSSLGMPVIFHSDGDIGALVPHLIEAGVRAFHPLEEESGIDIERLIRDYKKDAVFMGCVDIRRRGFMERIKDLGARASYIYSSAYPIGPDVSLTRYKYALETVKGTAPFFPKGTAYEERRREKIQRGPQGQDRPA